jgi:hypothetical protein
MLWNFKVSFAGFGACAVLYFPLLGTLVHLCVRRGHFLLTPMCLLSQGWSTVAMYSGEVKDGKRAYTLGLSAGAVCVVAVYVGCSSGVVRPLELVL